MRIKRKILIIDDDRNISSFIKTVLEPEDYDVLTAYTGNEAEAMIASHCPDVILLDPVLPDMDGLIILENVRKWSLVPVIVVSARGDERSKVAALELGADDYIHKPFGTGELIARIRVAFRHISRVNGTLDGRFTVGGLVIDYNKYRCFVDGKDAGLTQSEFRLVALLGKNAGKVLAYNYIIQQMWGPNAKDDNQILRVNMVNIRRKIEKNPAAPRYIFTEAGVGYRMAEK